MGFSIELAKKAVIQTAN